MAIRGGRSVSSRNVRGRDREAYGVDPSSLPPAFLNPTNRGRMYMAPSYFDSVHALITWATDAITNAFLLKVVADGSFVANAATRALFASGFVSKDLLAGGFLKERLVPGGAAGDFNVPGIATADELVAVWEQDGTSGLLTDRTGEFTISAPDTINNGGGTDTTGDTLVVKYLDLT